ncbi:MAG TPA: hypothetical protein VFU73_14775 [Actinocrinis sp.]|nr:hypothetical protein [Actinocrinis sp.]
MKQRRITISIDGNGKITADADGFTGDACINDLQQLLGGLDTWLEVTRKHDDGGGAVRNRVSTALGNLNTTENRRRIGGTQ